MPTIVNLEEAKVPLDELVARAESRDEVVLTIDDQPVARLVSAVPVRKARTPNLHAGETTMSDDFNEPLPENVWLGVS